MKKIFKLFFSICLISVSLIILSSCGNFKPDLKIEAKQVYYIGDEFSEDDIIIKYYKESSEAFQELSIDDVSFSGIDTASTGKKSYTIEYEGVSKTIEYEVFSLQIKGIKQLKNVKNEYLVGSTRLETTKWPVEVDVKLNNGETITVELEDVYYQEAYINSNNTSYMLVNNFSAEEVGSYTANCMININFNYKNSKISGVLSYNFSYKVVYFVKSIDNIRGVETTYYIGESLKLNSNAQIYFTDYTNFSSTVALTKDMITDFSTDTIGTRKMTITYKECTKTIEYKVLGIKEFQYANVATSYFVGESLRQDTETLMGIYISFLNSDNEICYAKEYEFEIINFSTKVAGNFVMTILYKGQSFNINYTVKEIVMTEFTIKINQIYVGDSVSDIVIKSVYCKFNDGDECYILDFKREEFSFSEFTSAFSGTHQMKVTYKGLTINYSYTVLDVVPTKILSVHNIPTTLKQGENYDFENAYLICENNNGTTDTIKIDRISMVYKVVGSGFSGELTNETGNFKMVIMLLKKIGNNESILVDKYYIDYVVE